MVHCARHAPPLSPSALSTPCDPATLPVANRRAIGAATPLAVLNDGDHSFGQVPHVTALRAREPLT